MTVLIYLIPIALLLGLAALFAFLWALKSGQFDDMDGAASRILFDEDDERPQPPKKDEDEVKDSGASPDDDARDDAPDDDTPKA